MPRRCIIAGCNTEGKQGHSLHHFPNDEATRAKWVKAVHGQRLNWKGNLDGSLICSMHFEPECFDTESRNREKMGLPAKKPCLIPGAIPTIFPKPESTECSSSDSKPSTLPCRPASERRQRKAVSIIFQLSYIIANGMTKYFKSL